MKQFRLPVVERYNELPDWIRSSDTACYHPLSNTIYIRKDCKRRTLLHEYVHWFAHWIGGERCFLHRIVDRGRINLQ